jgi:hypothetical protein
MYTHGIHASVPFKKLSAILCGYRTISCVNVYNEDWAAAERRQKRQEVPACCRNSFGDMPTCRLKKRVK